MQITGASLTPYRLPFKRPWKSGAGTWHERRGWLIRITDKADRCGYGDCAPLPTFGTENNSQAEEWLNRQLTTLAGQHPEQACHELGPETAHPAARCGLESALLDLWSRQRGLPLCRLLSDQPATKVRLNAALGTLDDSVAERAANSIATGFTTLKLKLGLYPTSTEMQRLRRLCQRLPADIRLRLDANRAWQEEEAAELITQLNELPVESLEEPLADPDPATLGRLQAVARFDLALDESLPRFIRKQTLQPLPVNRIVLKPTCLGGLLPTRELIQQASRRGIACIISSSLESSAGLWPLLHLAAAVDDPERPATHGLATADCFSHDLGSPPAIRHGMATLGKQPGSGFILER